MKISNSHMANMINNYKKQSVKAKEQVASSSVSKKDRSEISEQAKLYQATTKDLRNLPEVREEKIAAIKKDIDSGTYKVSGKDVAKKMITYSLNDLK